MGIRDWLGGRRGFDNELQEMMNPCWPGVSNFVAFPRNEDGYISHFYSSLISRAYATNSSCSTIKRWVASNSSTRLTGKHPRRLTSCSVSVVPGVKAGAILPH